MKILKSCRIGSRHRKNGKPCQDRCRTLKAGQRHIFLIADGHSHPSHCRSGIAAAMVCQVAQDVLSDPHIPYEVVPQMIKSRFDRSVRKHLQLFPLSFCERQLLYGHTPETAYGTTLLVAVVSPQGTYLLRLGDGEIHAMDADGSFFPALKGKLVSSMFSNDAEQNMETAFYPQTAAAIMMFSDGFCSPEARPAPLVRQMLEPDATALRENILQAGDCGDDQTVILAMDTSITTTPEFQSALKHYLAGLEVNRELATLERKLQSSKAILSGMIRKLEAIGPSSKDWNRVLAELLKEGQAYTTLLDQCDKVIEGGM